MLEEGKLTEKQIEDYKMSNITANSLSRGGFSRVAFELRRLEAEERQLKGAEGHDSTDLGKIKRDLEMKYAELQAMSLD